MLLGIGVSAFASKIVTDSIYSKTLNFTHKYNVYLPDGYDKGDQKYPVVYLFHGMYGGYSDWVKMGNMKLVADELIASGEACLMPETGTSPRSRTAISTSPAGTMKTFSSTNSCLRWKANTAYRQTRGTAR